MSTASGTSPASSPLVLNTGRLVKSKRRRPIGSSSSTSCRTVRPATAAVTAARIASLAPGVPANQGVCQNGRPTTSCNRARMPDSAAAFASLDHVPDVGPDLARGAAQCARVLVGRHRRPGVVVEHPAVGAPVHAGRKAGVQAEADRRLQGRRPARGRAQWMGRPVEGADARAHVAALLDAWGHGGGGRHRVKAENGRILSAPGPGRVRECLRYPVPAVAIQHE